MPSITDPTFGRSVIYLYDHNKDGAMGLIINKPMQITLGTILNHLNIPTEIKSIASQSVIMGGPIGQEHGFVLHDQHAKNKTGIYMSASKAMLEKIAEGAGPKNYIVMLGYSGWDAEQLSQEVRRNDWLVAPAKREILFDTPVEKRWQEAANLLGVDINKISGQFGHG